MSQNAENRHLIPPLSDLWTLARQDYLSGVSALIVAERYGVSERTLRRRAAAEGWRRADGSAEPRDGPRSRSRGFFSRQGTIEQVPELADVEQAAFTDRFNLLVNPDQKSLRRFAFEQAAEAAALSRPAESLVWMRLVQSLERTGDRIEWEAPGFRDQDLIRAAAFRHEASLRTGGAAPDED